MKKKQCRKTMVATLLATSMVVSSVESNASSLNTEVETEVTNHPEKSNQTKEIEKNVQQLGDDNQTDLEKSVETETGEGEEGALEKTPQETTEENEAFYIIDENLHKYNGSDTEVVIPDGVKSIYQGAFKDVPVEKLVIPSSVKSINSEAFKDCQTLKEIEIANGLEEIGYNAFKNCSSLTKVVLPDSVTEINSHAFENCENLKEIVFGNGIKVLPYGVCHNCSSLEKVVLPNCLLEIGSEAFMEDGALKEITLPDTLLQLHYNCFAQSGLTSITIPSSVEVWESNAFKDCKELSVVTLKDGLKNIPAFAFVNNPKLKQINMPKEGLEQIENFAFENIGLEQIEIPSCESMDFWIFQQCDELQEITLGVGVKCIGAFSLSGIKSLKKVNLSYGVDVIGAYAFGGDTELESLTIPNSVTTINSQAFFGCNKLQVSIPSSVKKLGTEALFGTKRYNDDVEEFKKSKKQYFVIDHFLQGIVTIRDEIYKDPTKGTGVLALPNEETGDIIGVDYLCADEAKELVIKEGIVSVSGLQNMQEMEKVTLADSVKFIDACSFSGCEKLQEAKLPAYITEISYACFKQCSNLSKIEIPQHVEQIGGLAFFACTALQELALPEGLKVIGAEAFKGCTGLKELTIPESVDFIGENAFAEVSENFKLKVYEGSLGETYAKENNIPYELLPKVTTSKKAFSSGVKKAANHVEAPEGQYKVTLDAQDGLCEKDYIFVKNEGDFQELPVACKAGADFAGWYTATDGGTKIINSTMVNLDSDITLYARFSDKKIEVSFQTPNGRLISPNGQVIDEFKMYAKVDAPYGQFPTAERDGYTFVGWYTQPEHGQLITEDMLVQSGDNLTLYAHWISTKDQTFNYDNLHYDFTNYRGSFNYTNPYRIPVTIFQYLYGKNAKAKAMYDSWPDWGGSCFGMVTSATLLAMQGDSVELKDFSTNYEKNADVKTDSINASTRISLTQLIETLHIAQRESKVAEDKDTYVNDFTALSKALHAVTDKQGLPIILSLHSAKSGHAVVAYKMNQKKIYIYDPNDNKEQTIDITLDNSGNIQTWAYKINGEEECGTSVEGSWISFYTMESVIQAWEKRNSDYYSKANLIQCNSKDFTISTSKGAEIARVENGQLITAYPDVYLCDSDEDQANDQDMKLYIPVGCYVFENTGSVAEFAVTAMGTDRITKATTKAKKLTLDLVEEQKKNVCSIIVNNGQDYQIEMCSTALGEKTNVIVAGTGNGNEVEVEQNQGSLAFENCTGEVKVNDQNVELVEVNAQAGAGGSISRLGKKSVVRGEDTVYAMMPNPGYMVSKVVVDGRDCGNVSSYTFTQINSNHSIQVEFVPIDFSNLAVATLDQIQRGVLPSLQVRNGNQILVNKEDYTYEISGDTNEKVTLKIKGINQYAGCEKVVSFPVGTQAGTEISNPQSGGTAGNTAGNGNNNTSASANPNASNSPTASQGSDTKTSEKNTGASATTKVVGGLKYKVTSEKNNTATVIKKVSSKKSFVVADTITIGENEYDVTAIGKNVWKNDNKVTTIVIGANVKRIGAKAFAKAKKIKKIKVNSKKITKVGSGAFSGLSGKIVVKVPASKKSAYKSLFSAKGLKKNCICR